MDDAKEELYKSQNVRGWQALDSCICILLEDHSATQLDQAIKRVFEIIGCKNPPSIDVRRDQVAILNRYVKKIKENSLLIQCPEIAKQWDYEKNGNLLPHMVSKGSEKHVWWICPNGHSYSSVIKSRTGPMHAGCKYCGRELTAKKTSKRVRCIETEAEFDSIADAARFIGQSSGGITTSCKKGYCAGDFHWEYVDTSEN